MDYFNYRRRLSSVVRIGDTPLGGNYPIRIQSMATASTRDTASVVNQAIRMIKAGAEYVRFTARNEREAINLRNIRQLLSELHYHTPLVADIHFNPNVADKAALYVEKVRINPGNYVDIALKNVRPTVTEEDFDNKLKKIRERFIHFLKICQQNKTAIRIGVNHGSLSDRITNRYGDTPEGMVESCMEFLRLCVEQKFDQVVLSIKASNTVVMIRTVRLLVQTMDAANMHFPIHLGVTEAGDGEDGRIKSAVGIGALLVDGIGDTIRVSLSEAPEAELPVARKLVDYIASLTNHPCIPAIASPKYNPIHPTKRFSRAVAGIGGDHPPIVAIAGTSDSQPIAGKGDNPRPFIIIDHKDTFPLFSIVEKDEIACCEAKAKFISMTCNDLNDDTIHLLKTDRQTIAIVNSSHKHYVGEVRAFMHRLLESDCDVPVIFRREYDDEDIETVQIKAAVDFGALLTDGFGDGLLMSHTNKSLFDDKMLENCMFSI